MKYRIYFLAGMMLTAFTFNAQAQKPDLKKESFESKAISVSSPEVNQLKRPVNDKNKQVEAAPKKAMGDVFGDDYSDIIIDNWSGYYVDIYVNGNFRGTIPPYEKQVTWAIPGNNTLYAKAPFRDGSYYYWGPKKTATGYSYTWKLNP